MNDAYAEAEGRPQRVRKPHVNLGVAVDVTKKDGSRTLLVPNIKLAEELDFAEFVATFDNLVGKARRGTIEPEAFLGTSISLTNPGTLGTTSSSPRLMPGQGCIVATGRDGLPARVPGDARGDRREPRDLPRHGGHLDVRPPDRPGGRVGGVPRDAPGAPPRRRRLLRADLQGPEGPPPSRRVGAGPEPALPRRLLAPRDGREAGADPAAHQLLPRPRAPPRRPRPARRRHAPVPRRARPGDVRLHALGPRPEVRHERPRGPRPRDAPGDPRGPPPDLLRQGRRRVHEHPGPRAEEVAHGPDGVLPEPRDALGRRQDAGARQARRGGELREVPPRQVRRTQALLPRGGRGGRSRS